MKIPEDFRKKSKIWMKVAKRILKYIALIFISVSVFFILLFKFEDPPLTIYMICESNLSDIQHSWINIEDISPDALKAVIIAEDKNFPEHFGFDFGAIHAAFRDWLWGKKLRGASTISQQTAKNLFLWKEPGIIKKGIEIYFTIWIELLWSKKRILEVYLNIIEMNKNVYGINAASKLFFNKTASGLTKEESILLAARIPSPTSHNSEIIYKNKDRITGEIDKYDYSQFLKSIYE
jgi:monofunctional glycosyltransferase